MAFLARNSAERFWAETMSTYSTGTLMPFSARKIRTRRGFGAVLES